MERSDPLWKALWITILFQALLFFCVFHVQLQVPEREWPDRIELALISSADDKLSQKEEEVVDAEPERTPPAQASSPSRERLSAEPIRSLPPIARAPVTALPPLPRARPVPPRVQSLPRHESAGSKGVGLRPPSGGLKPTWSPGLAKGGGAVLPLPESPTPGALPRPAEGGPVIEGPASRRQVLHREIPAYPEGVRKEARVVLEFVVRPDGSVGEVAPIRRLEPALDEVAVEAMRRWRFAPKPGSMDAGRVTFVFVLRPTPGFR